MKPHITEICNKDLKRGVFANTQFIFIAESCAMGEAGKVMILTSGGSIFQGNYCFGDIKLSKLYCAIPTLKDCVFDPLGDDGKIPAGWEYEYLGSGNHLIVREDIYAEFKADLKDAKYPEDIYPIWFDVAWNIIEEQNREKSPLSTKTHEELLLLMNKELQHSETMTEEEQIEYDSEYGYDPDEEEICCEKIETTQTYREFVKKVQQEYENKGNARVQFGSCAVWKSGDQINLWTYWQGYQIEKIEKGIDILLVGQDWGNPKREPDVVERIKQF